MPKTTSKELYTEVAGAFVHGGMEVNIFLKSGAKLQGVITEVRDDGLMLTRNSSIMYVARSAIASIGEKPDGPEPLTLYHEGRRVI